MVQFRDIVSDNSTRTLSSADQDTPIILGSTPVYLQLKTNPSTGYSLIVDNSTINDVFTYDSLYQPYKNYLTEYKLLGAGGTQLF